MATCRWAPRAAKRTEIKTVTITANDVATRYALTINGKVISVLGNAGGINNTATDLATAWNAALATVYPEFAEVTAFNSNTNAIVTLTADTAGRPFTVTSSVSGGAGTIGAVATTTTATSQNHWDDSTNWSSATVPADGDNVYLENSDVPVKYGMAQGGVTLNSLNVAASYTGTIGLPELNQDSSTAYHEYRGQYLQVGSTNTFIGAGPGRGSGRIKLDNGSAQTTLNLLLTGTAAEVNLEAVQWKGTHASNAANVFKGSIALAGYGGDSGKVLNLRVGYVSSPSSDARVRCGAGLTLTTLNMEGGQVEVNGDCTTVSKRGGTLTVQGAGTVTTLTDDQGTTDYLSTGTITTLNVGSDATVDFGGSDVARTVTNTNLYEGATLLAMSGSVAFTNGFATVRCSLENVRVNVGQGKTYIPS